jgi:hypothetical protein
MNYLNYIQNIFTDYEVTDELNYQYNGQGNAIVIKYLNGSNFRDSLIQPVQLSVYTTDLVTVREELNTFTSTYNNSPFFEQQEYIQQIYSTPMLLTPFDKSGNNYTHNLIIQATLLISKNVSDIKTVKIDNVEYETTSRMISYITQIDNQRISNNRINISNVSYASVKFNCEMINKSDVLGTLYTKISSIRRGILSINTSFTIQLIYNSNSLTETYTMKLDSAVLNSSNQSLPTLSLSFTQ